MDQSAGFRTFRCGHVRDSFNSRGRKHETCRTCYTAKTRARYRRLRDEGMTPNEIFGYRPLSEADLAAMLQRMGTGMTLGQATAGPSSYPHSTLYRRLRIWAPSNHDRAILIKRLSKLNVSTQRRRRWEASRPRDEPDTFPRVDPQNLDHGLIEGVVRSAIADADLRNEIRQALIIDLLEGRCCYDNIRNRARHHLDQHFRQAVGNRSLDERTGRDGAGPSLGDRVAWKMWDSN
jgi:hypothetical protein